MITVSTGEEASRLYRFSALMMTLAAVAFVSGLIKRVKKESEEE